MCIRDRLEREADHVMTLTDRARAIVLERTKRPAEAVGVVPCCVDLEWMQASQPAQVGTLRHELGLTGGRPVIGYLGSLGGWYLAQEMFACFAAWRAHQPMTFLVVTQDEAARVFALAAGAGLAPEDVRVRGAGRAQVPHLVQLMDVGLFFIRPCYSKLASSPTKLAEFLAAGKPVVTLSGTGDLDAQLAGQPFACVLCDTTPAEYERAFAALPALMTADPAGARAFAATHYSLELGADRYAAAYRHMLAAQDSPLALR
jgi:glycosyltransferase involved in cell wall biosynthesis